MSNYKEAVAEARQLVKRSEDDQWRLAQLTWEQVQAGKTRKQWAQDIGVSETHARILYTVWNRFQDQTHDVRFSFGDRYEMAKTGTEGPRAARESQAVGTVRNMPPERKAELVRELTKDDAVVAAAASRALEERNAELPTPRVRERTKSDRYSDALTAMRAADAAIDRFANAVSGAEWTAVEADSFETILARWSGAIELIRAGLQSGTWDDELAKLTGSL
jgi:hypothetical protein